jgi:heparosan-N-sulfate-glucuronate 5-epimerase
VNATRHLRSAFSLGPGYERTPLGSAFERDSVRGYFIDFTAKTTSSTAQTPEALNPAGLAQLGLGWWERSLRGESTAEGRFLGVCTVLEGAAVPERGALWWPSKLTDTKYVPLSVYSALPQAQVVSVFLRAFLLTEDPRWQRLALEALGPLLPGGDSELVFESDEGPVLEEVASDPPSHILNGWIYALWGLWEAKIVLEHDGAEAMLDSSLQCLRSKLQLYDVGWWSRYSLYPHVLPDLAKPFYHALHVDQLDVLHRLFGGADLADTAARWRRYDTPVGRVRAVAQKAAFVVSGYR